MSESITTKVVTGLARLSFWKGWNGQKDDKDVTKWGGCIIIPKTDKITKRKLDAAYEAAKALGKEKKWGGKVPKHNNPIKDGDDQNPDDDPDVKVYPELEGCWYMNVSAGQRPQILDRFQEEIDEAHADQIYSGCYVLASLNVFPFVTKDNTKKGVAIGLNNLLKVKDGERFAGRSSASDDFKGVNVDQYLDEEDLDEEKPKGKKKKVVSDDDDFE